MSKKEITNGEPGKGWTNGDLPQSMFPLTLEGKVSLYSNQRRWINAKSSWTRIGAGSALDAVHSESGAGALTTTQGTEEEASVIKSLISQLCEKFYNNGWATGTGGGVSIRVGGPSENRPWRVFVAPSGIQKEDMIGEDVFEMDMDQKVVKKPVTPNLRLSACTPLWYVVYANRPSAKCVIHTHSMNAQMATLLDPSESSDTLDITYLEMLKGVGGHAYDDLLKIPIIDNRPTEDLLADQLESAIKRYPKANAVLVRRHGIYCWGDSWEQAKTQMESFDYLFESAIKMRAMGINFSKPPKSGTYRRNKKKRGADESGEGNSKKRKMNSSGFNGVSEVNNAADLVLTNTTVPLLPRDSKVLLLDIEGCTTSISFVKDVLFPYVLNHIGYRVKKMGSKRLSAALDGFINDVSNIRDLKLRKECISSVPNFNKRDIPSMQSAVKAYLEIMVNLDIKGTALKALQGDMWKDGYNEGHFKGHVYSDLKPLLEWCKENAIAVSIYSSGSINAQKLLFGHSTEGDLTGYFSSHFDTTSGNKKVRQSYINIAQSLNVYPKDIIFVSDAEAELVAAREAGIGFPVMSVRPGNAPMTDVGKAFPKIYSLLQLCGM